MGKLGAILGTLILVGALGACTPITRYYGYAPSEADLAQLTLGKDTRESVTAAVGRPITTGTLNDGFYYVESTFQTVGPFAPREVDREILAMTFRADGTLGSIERFGLEAGRVVPISRRTTEGAFANPSVIAQILANFGGLDTSRIIGNNAPER